MKRFLQITILLLLASSAAHAQNSWFSGVALGINPFTAPNPGGTPGPVYLSYAPVRVCNLPLTQTQPCLPLATITDLFNNPLSVGGPANFGQLTTNVVGGYQFGCQPGQNLQIQVAPANSATPSLSFPATCPSGQGPFSISLNTTNAWTGVNNFANINGLRVVDGNRFTTIQAAITDAGTTGGVMIPPAYAGTDSFTNPNNIPIIDMRFGSASYTRQIDVKDYGAKGDGATDDTTSIQAALTAAAAAGNARVVFPCSSTPYLIGSTLNYGALTWIDAAAFRCATIRVKGGLGQTIEMMQPLAAGQAGSKISNLIFDQATDVYTTYSSSTQLLSVNATLGMIVENCEFKNVMTMAIWADSTAANPTKKLIIRSNRIDNSLGGGISMFGTLIDHLIEGNIVENTEDDSIAHQWDTNGAPTGFVAVGNMVRHAGPRNTTNSTPHCILVYGAVTNFTVAGNTCDSSVAPGIDVAYDATTVHRPSQGVVSGNTVINGGTLGTVAVPGQGILVIGADHVSVTGNSAQNSRSDGMRIFQSTDITASGNVVRASGDSGIQVEASQRVTLSGNTAVDSGFSGASSTPYGIMIINDGASAGQFVDRFTAGFNVANDTRSGGSRTQTFGFFISGANSGTLRVAFNNFQDNVTGALGGLNPVSLFRFENDGDATASNLANPLASPVLNTPTLTGVTNGTGLQLFSTSTTCTTPASIGGVCTTAAITLPVGYSDSNYRLSCTGQGATQTPIVETYTKSNTTFTITVAALTANAASFASFDCSAGHN